MSGAGQPNTVTGGGIIPEGFVLLTQSKAQTATSVLPDDTANTNMTLTSINLQEALVIEGADLIIMSKESGSKQETPIGIVPWAVSTPLPPQQMFETVRFLRVPTVQGFKVQSENAPTVAALESNLVGKMGTVFMVGATKMAARDQARSSVPVQQIVSIPVSQEQVLDNGRAVQVATGYELRLESNVQPSATAQLDIVGKSDTTSVPAALLTPASDNAPHIVNIQQIVGVPVSQEQVLDNGRAVQVGAGYGSRLESNVQPTINVQLDVVDKTDIMSKPAGISVPASDRTPRIVPVQQIVSIPVLQEQVLDNGGSVRSAPAGGLKLEVDITPLAATRLDIVSRSRSTLMSPVTTVFASDQTSQSVAERQIASSPVPEQQVVNIPRASAQQPKVQAETSSAIVAPQLGATVRSDRTIVPAISTAQSADEVAADWKTALVKIQPVKVPGTPIQTTPIAPVHAEKDIVQLGSHVPPLPQSSNSGSQKLSAIEVVAQQFVPVKVASISETQKPVAPEELGLVQLLKVQPANPDVHQSSAANTDDGVKPIRDEGHLPETARKTLVASQTQSAPQLGTADKKQVGYHAPVVVTDALRPEGDIVQESSVEASKQEGQRPMAIVEVSARFAVLSEQGKTVFGTISLAKGASEQLDFAERGVVGTASVLAPNSTAELSRAISAQDLSPKAAPKPFTDAIITQIRSVELSKGHTTITLAPAGLGSIEIEIVSEKDVASRVVVRVENPAVLQALREDRQLLAQAIGVSDSNIFDFQEHDAQNQSGSRHNKNDQSAGALSDSPAAQMKPQHLDVVHEGRLDILT